MKGGMEKVRQCAHTCSCFWLMTLDRLLSMFQTTVKYWIETPKMPIVPWKCMVLLTMLLQFEQLAFCFSRGGRTRNEYLLITLCKMTVHNSCSGPAFEASAVSAHELYVSAAQLLTAAWAADTLTPRKYIGFFSSPSQKIRISEEILRSTFC